MNRIFGGLKQMKCSWKGCKNEAVVRFDDGQGFCRGHWRQTYD